MMGNINIKINKETRQVNLAKSVIGNDGENLQEKLVFSFNSFVNGTARLELLKQGEAASYIMLTKVGETYELPIKSVITKAGRLNMQLVITEGTDDEEIPVFKSNQFYMIVNSSINAEIEEDDEYPQWIDVANTKLNEIDDVLDDLQDKLDSGYFKGDKGDKGDRGEQGIQGIQGERGLQGEQGIQGIQGIQGEPGQNGQDGFSPSASVSQSGDITTISITDKAGTTSATIDLSNVGGEEIFEIQNNSQFNPFILDGKKKGLYINNSGDNFYYKVSSQSATRNMSGNLIDLYLRHDFNYNDSETYNDLASCIKLTTTGNLVYMPTMWVYGTTLQGNELGIGQLINSSSQTIQGIKTFNNIPRQNNTTAPTTNTEFTNKKYVDDSINNAIGNINTILATLTTPNGGE